MANNVTVNFTNTNRNVDPLGVGVVLSEFGGNPIPILQGNFPFVQGGPQSNEYTLLQNLAPGHLRASLAWYNGNPSYGAGGSPRQQSSGGQVASSLVKAIKSIGAIPLISYNGDSSDNGGLSAANGAGLVHFFNDNAGSGYPSVSGSLTQTGGNAGQQFLKTNVGPYLFQFNEWNSTQAYSCNYSYNAGSNTTAFSVASSSLSVSTGGAPAAYSSLVSGNHAVGSPNYTSPANAQFPIQNSAITAGKVLTSVAGTVIGTGAWDYAYDIWFSSTANPTGGVGNNGSGLEMMIWLNHLGGISPAGTAQAPVTINGVNYTPWVSSPNGPISYVMNTPVTSVTNLDLQPLIQDAIGRNLMTNNWYLIDVECGFEIWQGGAGLGITSFSCTNGASTGSTSQNGGPVQYWSIGNETEVTGPVPAYSSILAGMWAASPGINIGAPAAAFWDTGAITAVDAIANLGTLSYHAYDGSDTTDGNTFVNGGTQLFTHVSTDLPGFRGGIHYGVEEMNWHSALSSSSDQGGFYNWKNACFIADNLGQALSAGGHGTVYSDTNGALGIIGDGQQNTVAGQTMPAYWGIGIWTGMNGQFKRYSSHMVSATTTFPTTAVTVYACDNGKIVIINRTTNQQALTIGVTMPGGATSGTYQVWKTQAGSPFAPIIQDVPPSGFSGSTINYTIPASTAVSMDITFGGGGGGGGGGSGSGGTGTGATLFTPIGNPQYNSGSAASGVATFPLTANNVGDIVVVHVVTGSAATSIVMSGGSFTWTAIGTVLSGSVHTNSGITYVGTATAAGTSTVTMTATSTVTAYTSVAQEYQVANGFNWSADGTAQMDNASTNLFPSITPTVSDDLYSAYGAIGTNSFGQTPGFTYSTSSTNGYAYNNNAITAAMQPAWASTQSIYAIGCCLKATQVTAPSSLPLSNTFEGGTNGTVLTTANTDGASGNAFDFMSTGGNPPTFSTAQAAHGSYSVVCSTPAAGSVSYFGWTPSIGGGQPTLYGRANVFLSALPSVDDAIIVMQDGGAEAGGIQIAANGNFRTQGANFRLKSSASVVPVGQWFRLEWEIVGGVAGTGFLTIRYYNSVDSNVITETLTDQVNAYGAGANLLVDTVQFGWGVTHPSQPNLYLDDVKIATTGWIGPATTGGANLVNDFEEGTSGTAISTANSGGIGESAFDVVTIGTGTTANFSNTQAAHGSLSANFATGSTATPVFCAWTTSLGSQNTIYGRAYVYMTGYGSADTKIVQFKNAGAFGGGVLIASSGQLRTQNVAFGESSGGPIVPLNQWFRLEWKVVAGAAGAASLVVNYYSTMDGTVATGSTQDLAGQYGTSALINEVDFGWNESIASLPNMYMDNIGLSLTGFMGPSFGSPPVVVTQGATNVTATGAQLNGTVNPNGASTTYHFNYGLTGSYGLGSVPSPDGNVVTTFTTIGPVISANTASVPMAPQQVGDLVILEVINASNNTVTATAVTGGGCTWAVMKTVTGVTNAMTATVFAGTVTAAGAATATVSFSGTTPASLRIAGQEFDSPASSWALDVSGSIDSAGTNTFPSLSPASSGELYFGYAFDSGSASPGTTPGYTYAFDQNGNGIAINANCGGGAQAPVWGDSGSVFGIAVLMRPATSMTVTTTQSGTAAKASTMLAVRVVKGARNAAAQFAAKGNAQGSATNTTPDLSITPGGSGSYLYSGMVCYSTATPFTPVGTSTFFENANGAEGGDVFGMCVDTTSSSGVARTVGATAPTGVAGNFHNVVAEILSSTGLSEDGSTPAVALVNGTAATCNSFAPPPGSLLVAIVATQTTASGTQSVAITDSLGLTWQQLIVNPGGFPNTAIWVADVPAYVDEEFYNLTGLTPGTLYHYQIRAQNAAGTTFGNDITFTTAATGPTVTTNPATNAAYTSVTLNGTINPNGTDTTYQFQYGLTTGYGNNVPGAAVDIGSGGSPVNVAFNLTGLQPNTTYHYRVTATNSAGTTNGSDQSFTTGVSPTVFFPSIPLNMSVQILVNGSWQDITQFVYQRANISIKGRGRPDETQNINPVEMTLTLNNRGGTFSPNNTNSPFFPFVQNNTPIRVLVSANSPTVGYTGYRFYGEVRKWPPSWDPTGSDVWVSVTASGLYTRFSQGGNIGSPLKRWYLNKTDATAPIALWMCDELTGATRFQDSLPNGNAMTWNGGTPNLSSDSACAGTDPIAQFNGTTWAGLTGSYSGAGPVVFSTPGTYGWFCPAGVTTVTPQVWGGDGGGASGNTGNGGGAGEFATGSVGVTPGLNYVIVVGKGGDAGFGIPGAGGNGGASSFTGDTVQIKAFAGTGGGASVGTGGNASTAPTHFAGGNGGAGGTNGGGGGGGGGGGPTGAGGNGGAGQSTTPWAGGAGGTPGAGNLVGIGAGGAGAQSPTNRNQVIWAGPGEPAGGGGGGSKSKIDGANLPGAVGGPGRVVLNYSGGNAPGNVIIRFVLDIPKGGMPNGSVIVQGAISSGTLGIIEVYYGVGGKLGFRGWAPQPAGTIRVKVFDSGLQTWALNGVGPIMVSMEMVQSAAQVVYTLGYVKPGQPGSYTAEISSFNGTIGACSSITGNPNGNIQDTAVGVIVLQYAYEPLTVVAPALGGYAGELAADRVHRLCIEENVKCSIQGSGYWTFDDGTIQGWTPVNSGSLAVSTAQATVDQYSLVVTVPANSIGGAASPIGQALCSAGQIVSAYADVSPIGTPNQIQFSLVFYNASGVAIQSVVASGIPIIGALLVNDTFTTLSVTGLTAPVGTASVGVWLKQLTDNVAQTTFALDNVGIAIGSAMGPQPDDTFQNIIQQCEDVDRGLIIEPKNFFGLKYRSRTSLQNQAVKLQIDYAQAQLANSLQPVFDDSLIRNYITLSRPNGATYTTQLSTGALSVQNPPNGVGRYAYPVVFNSSNDTPHVVAGAWILAVGTVNDYRYQDISIGLMRSESAGMFAAVPSLEDGDRVQIINAPTGWLPSGTVEQLAWSFDEEINNFIWTFDIVGVPGSVFLGGPFSTW